MLISRSMSQLSDATVRALLNHVLASPAYTPPRPPRPLHCFAIARNKRGARVRIPMQPQPDGSLVSGPVVERCEAVALSVDGVIIPFKWLTR